MGKYKSYVAFMSTLHDLYCLYITQCDESSRVFGHRRSWNLKLGHLVVEYGPAYFSEEGVALEEYLTVEELCARVKYKRQSLYNLVHRKVFVLGNHYVKPGGKILFKWSRIQKWIEKPGAVTKKQATLPEEKEAPPKTGRIRI